MRKQARVGAVCPDPATPDHGSRSGGRSRRRFLASSASLVASLGLGACTMPLPAPKVATPTAVPAVSESVLPIGVILSLSGRYSREGAMMRAGYETWASEVQQAGGVRVGAGRRAVRLIFADDESEPLVAGRQAERLAQSDGVLLWLGPFTSAISLAVALAAERLGTLVVAPDASDGDIYRRGLKGIVSVLAPDERLFHGLADLAATAEPRAQPVGIIVADEPSIGAAAAGFRERAAALGLAPIRQELVALDARDISAPLERIAEISPRCLILATETGQTERFTPALRELVPFSTMRVLVPLPEPTLLGSSRNVLYDGVLTTETWWPSIAASGPVLGSALDFAERFRRLHGYEADPRAAAAAAAGLVLQLAVERAGTVDPKTVRDAFDALDVTTFWGRLAWDPAGRNRAAVAPVLQQQGDALVCVYPRELAGGQLRYPLAGWPRG